MASPPTPSGIRGLFTGGSCAPGTGKQIPSETTGSEVLPSWERHLSSWPQRSFEESSCPDLVTSSHGALPPCQAIGSGLLHL